MEKLYYVKDGGYSQLYWRDKIGGKEGEKEQKMLQFTLDGSKTIRNMATHEVHRFACLRTSDPVAQKELDNYIKLGHERFGGCNVMTEDQFKTLHTTLRIQSDTNEAAALVTEHNDLLARAKADNEELTKLRALVEKQTSPNPASAPAEPVGVGGGDTGRGKGNR
jgi:hypothetical protein